MKMSTRCRESFTMKRIEKKRRAKRLQLTKLIFGALMCAGGVYLASPGVASAAEATDTGDHPAATIKESTIASGQFKDKQIYFLKDTATYDTLILDAPGAEARMAAAYAPTGALSGFHVRVNGGTAK